MRGSPGVLKLSERVLLDVERIVGSFARKHRYVIGDDLRRDALAVARGARRAWRNRDELPTLIAALDEAIDDLKLTVDLAQQLRAFNGFAQYEELLRLVNDLGRQCGGWRKRHPKGQNRETQESRGRAQILSARDASQGASV